MKMIFITKFNFEKQTIEGTIFKKMLTCFQRKSSEVDKYGSYYEA